LILYAILKSMAFVRIFAMKQSCMLIYYLYNEVSLICIFVLLYRGYRPGTGFLQFFNADNLI
jgi:hypothetical protein